MKNTKFVIALVLLLSILVYFVNGAQQTKESSIFDGECSPPCWRNINPGNTTEQEAFDLIAKFSDAEIASVEKKVQHDIFNAYYTFELSNGVGVWIYTIDGVVAMISFYNDGGITTFGRCVGEFGAPDFATQSFYSSYGLPIGPTQAWHVLFTAISPHVGVSYGFDTYTYFGAKKYVNRGSSVIAIKYFDSQYYEVLLQAGWLFPAIDYAYEKRNVHPWVGYGNIFELYPVDQ